MHSGVRKQAIMLKWALLCFWCSWGPKAKKGVGSKSPYFKVGFETTFTDRERKDAMVGWHRWQNGHEAEQVPGDGEGQGSLACRSPLGCRVRRAVWRWCVCLLTCCSNNSKLETALWPLKKHSPLKSSIFEVKEKTSWKKQLMPCSILPLTSSTNPRLQHHFIVNLARKGFAKSVFLKLSGPKQLVSDPYPGGLKADGCGWSQVLGWGGVHKPLNSEQKCLLLVDQMGEVREWAWGLFPRRPCLSGLATRQQRFQIRCRSQWNRRPAQEVQCFQRTHFQGPHETA